MALKRSLLEDDQWVVPRNLYLTVFSPSSVNVLCFDPQRGADPAMNKTQVGDIQRKSGKGTNNEM